VELKPVSAAKNDNNRRNCTKENFAEAGVKIADVFAIEFVRKNYSFKVHNQQAAIDNIPDSKNKQPEAV
jgi:hypothetical protein